MTTRAVSEVEPGEAQRVSAHVEPIGKLACRAAGFVILDQHDRASDQENCNSLAGGAVQ